MKKLFISVLVLCIVALIFIWIGYTNHTLPTDAQTKSASSNKERISFIKSFGWEVDDEPYETTVVLIPQVFSKVLTDYNHMLIASGFDLKPYAGYEVIRYSYKLTNHPMDNQFARVNLFVYHNNIIGADVSSTKLDGFMHAIDNKNILKSK